MTRQLVPKHDASVREPDATVIPIEAVPQEEAEIAERLFGAAPVQRSALPRAMPRWRDQIGPPAELPANTSDRPPEPQSEDSPRVIEGHLEPAATNAATGGMSAERPRPGLPLWIALFAVSAVGMILVYSFATTSEGLPERMPAFTPSESPTAHANSSTTGPIPLRPEASQVPLATAATQTAQAIPVPPANPPSVPRVSQSRKTVPVPARSASHHPETKPSATSPEIKVFGVPFEMAPKP